MLNFCFIHEEYRENFLKDYNSPNPSQINPCTGSQLSAMKLGSNIADNIHIDGVRYKLLNEEEEEGEEQETKN